MSSLATLSRVALWLCLWGIILVGPNAVSWGQTAPTTKGKARPERSGRAERPKKADADPATQPKAEPGAKTAERAASEDEESEDPKPAADDAKKKEAEKPRSLFGDSKRFTRNGGWGGIGGTMGQWGMARSALITSPAVQEELKLSEKQAALVRKWLEDMRKSGEEMGRSLREQGGDPAQQGDVPVVARVLQFTTLMSRVSTMIRENEAGLSRILTSPQRKRLDQIALQMEGIAAIARPEVAEKLNISPERQELIRQVIAESRSQQMTTFIEQGTAMARLGRNPRPGGTPDARPAGPDAAPETGTRPGARTEPVAAADRNRSGGPPADPKARAEQAKAMRQQFDSMRDKTDQIQEQTARKILRLLTKKQQAAFDRMLGPPFDPSKVSTFGRPGGGPPVEGQGAGGGKGGSRSGDEDEGR